MIVLRAVTVNDLNKITEVKLFENLKWNNDGSPALNKNNGLKLNNIYLDFNIHSKNEWKTFLNNLKVNNIKLPRFTADKKRLYYRVHYWGVPVGGAEFRKRSTLFPGYKENGDKIPIVPNGGLN